MSRWANIAVCELCRERQPLWNSHDGLRLQPITCTVVILECSVGLSGEPRVARLQFDSCAEKDSLWNSQQPRFAQGLFSIERTWQEYWGHCPNEWNVEKAERQHAPIRANMGQHCSLSAVQRKTACEEQSWWPGSMPWCSFPWFTIIYITKVIYAGLPVDISVFLCWRK